MEKKSVIVRKQFNREEGAMWSASSERFSKQSEIEKNLNNAKLRPISRSKKKNLKPQNAHGFS